MFSRLPLLKMSVLGFALALSGCASEPIGTSEAKPVPEKRIYSVEDTNKKEGDSEIIVKRDASQGGYCPVLVFIDGKKIAGLYHGEKVSIYAKPGEYILSAKNTSLCVGGLQESDVVLKEGDVKVYRIGFGVNGDMSISRTAF